MSAFTYGEDSWDANSQKRNLFLKTETGQNIVRVVSSPWRYWAHWTFDVAGKKKKVKCALECCPVCEKVEKEMKERDLVEEDGKKQPHKEARKPRWLFVVISRKNGDIKILDAGPQVVNGIKDLNDKPQLGNPSRYDIDITVNPESKRDYYTVAAIPNEAGQMIYPLTEEEKKKVAEFMAEIKMEDFIVPDSPEKIRKILGLVKSENEEESDDDGVDNDFSSSSDFSDTDSDDFADFQ